MDNKITLKEAMAIIADFGIDSDNFIQSNFKQFLNGFGDADDNSIDLHYHHSQCLKIVVNEGIKAITELEATKLALTKLQADVLENYVPKSEYEELDNIAGTSLNVIVDLRKQLAKLKAENEKLSAQRNNGKVVVQYLDDNNHEEYDSFQEAKEAILESFIDKDEGIHPNIESIKVLQEIYKIEVPENPDGTYGITFVPTKVSDELSQARQSERERIVEKIRSDNYSVTVISEETGEPQQITAMINDSLNDYKEYLAKELSQAITADQPKSCEGCEHKVTEILCTKNECRNYDHYQPKEK